MLKLLLIAAGLTLLLNSSTAVNFTVTTKSPANCSTPCYTLDEYATNTSLLEGQANISLILQSGTHHLYHDLNISGFLEVTIHSINQTQEVKIVVHDEARIMVSGVYDFILSGVCIQAEQNGSSRGQNQTLQLLDAVNTLFMRLWLKGVNTLIRMREHQEHSTAIVSCYFSRSELLITSDSESEQNETTKQIKIENSTFSGNYNINSSRGSLTSLITKCKSNGCPTALTFKCPMLSARSSSTLILDIEDSHFSDWYSGIAFQCKKYEVSHFIIDKSSFTRVTNGVDISSSNLTQIAVLNSEFTDFNIMGIGTALSSLENFKTRNITKDFSFIDSFEVVGSKFNAIRRTDRTSACIDLSLWNIHITTITQSQLVNSKRGICSTLLERLKLQARTQNGDLRIEHTNITKSNDAILLYSMSIQSIVVTDCIASDNTFAISLGRSTVENFAVEYTTIENNSNFGIYFYNVTFKTVAVLSSVISHNRAQGIHMFESFVESIYLFNSTLSKNRNGMLYEAVARSLRQDTETLTDIVIHYMTVSDNIKDGIILSDLSLVEGSNQANISLQNCLFNSNGRSGISVQNLGSTFSVQDCDFIENKKTAVIAFMTNIELEGSIQFINNTGVRGGALSLIHSQVRFADNSRILFTGNLAAEYGGAIYVVSLKYLGLITFRDFFIDAEEAGYEIIRKFPCFYLFNSHNLSTVNISVTLRNNNAALGGENIYGASLFDYCSINTLSRNNSDQRFDIESIKRIFNFEDASKTSSISSDPTRVCFCSSNTTNCNRTKLVHNEIRYPGEEFTVPLILVGYEFGTLTGIIHATVITDTVHPLDENQQAHTASKENCNLLKYSIHSQPNTQYAIKLTTQVSPRGESDLEQITISMESIQNQYCVDSLQCTAQLTTPIYVNITLEECPLGFKLNQATLTCECDETLSKLSERKNISCDILDHRGLIKRKGALWVGVDKTVNVSHSEYLWNEYCPKAYCKYNSLLIDPAQPDRQCQLYRSGVLCGSCKAGYSLLLGSNRCAKCADNAGIALVLFFLMAGFLLVMVIKFLDLTVANGTVNGIIFYANVVWGYNQVLLPAPSKTDPLHWLLTVPIAWINLDFGIEACFSVGLGSFVKAWLQFLFPIYIWSIAGLIILISHYSRRATKLFGNNSVAVLSTLLLLSYGKILRNTITILDSMDMYYSNSTDIKKVWAPDGNLEYAKYPHGFLFAFAILVLVVAWLPYNLALLFVPILKSKSRHRPLRWINTLKPFFDTYYGPYNDQRLYQCWTGILMLTRGILLVVLAAASNPYDNILFLGIISAILLATASISIYKKLYLSISEIIYLVNLAILSALWSRYNSLTVTTTQYPVYTAVSISFALLQFSCLIATHLIQKFCWSRVCARKKEPRRESMMELESFEATVSKNFEDSSRYRDSILSYISYTD